MSTPPLVERLTYDPADGVLRYLWLQYIEGVDLDQHCKKSFVGTTSQRIATRLIQGVDHSLEFSSVLLDEGPARAYYLCGVSDPYVYTNNVHLAFVSAPGESFDFESGPITARFLDARRLPITTSDIDSSHPHASDPAYATCRNWQFAWSLA